MRVDPAGGPKLNFYCMRTDNTGSNYMLILVALTGAVFVTFAISAGKRMPSKSEFIKMRQDMVRNQIEARGVKDERVLDAMRNVERHKLMPEDVRPSAYEDQPLPIGYGQTISQPYIVAYMTEALNLRKGDRVLEIGTGSGYQAAVLAELGAEVYSIEIVEELAMRARKDLAALGYGNITIRSGDGYGGWPEKQPFDAIILTAAPPGVPRPLLDQLANGGRLIAPVGSYFQNLVRYTRIKDGFRKEELLPVAFVPMTGEAQKKNK